MGCSSCGKKKNTDLYKYDPQKTINKTIYPASTGTGKYPSKDMIELWNKHQQQFYSPNDNNGDNQSS